MSCITGHFNFLPIGVSTIVLTPWRSDHGDTVRPAVRLRTYAKADSHCASSPPHMRCKVVSRSKSNSLLSFSIRFCASLPDNGCSQQCRPRKHRRHRLGDRYGHDLNADLFSWLYYHTPIDRRIVRTSGSVWHFKESLGNPHVFRGGQATRNDLETQVCKGRNRIGLTSR